MFPLPLVWRALSKQTLSSHTHITPDLLGQLLDPSSRPPAEISHASSVEPAYENVAAIVD